MRARQNVEVLKALPSWREFRELLQTPVAREQDGDLNADLDDDDDDEDDEEDDDDDEAVGGKEGPGTQEKSQGSPRGAAGERDDGAQVAPMRLSFEAEDWSALAGDALRSRGPESSVDQAACTCLTETFVIALDASANARCVCPSRYGFDQQQSECYECPEGKAKATTGNGVCTDCEPGKYQTQPRNEQCLPCSAGLYSNEPGAVTCLSCPEKISSYNGSRVCDICAAGFYRDLADVQASIFTCDDCPDNAECGVDTTLATLRLKPGYWRLNATARLIYACETGDETGLSACVGGTDDGVAGDGYCRGNHTGAKCESCIHSEVEDIRRYFSENDGICKDCPDASGQIGILIAIGISMMLLLYIVYTLYNSPPDYLWARRVSMKMHQLLHWIIGKELQAKIKASIVRKPQRSNARTLARGPLHGYAAVRARR